MLRIIFDNNDGYFYIKEGECKWNIKFITEQEAYEYMCDALYN